MKREIKQKFPNEVCKLVKIINLKKISCIFNYMFVELNQYIFIYKNVIKFYYLFLNQPKN